MKILKLFILMFIPYGLIGQSSGSVRIGDTLSKDQYFIILKKQFTDVANNSDKTTIGNFASADIKDGKLAFNATKNFDNGSWLSLNANGSITDGFFSVFTETNINTNAGANLKYSYLFKKPSTLSYYEGNPSKLNGELKEIGKVRQYRNMIDSNTVVQIKKEYYLGALEIIALEKKKTSLDSLNPERIKIELLIAKTALHMDSLQMKLAALPNRTDKLEYNSKLEQNERKSAIENFEFEAIGFHWFSVGAGFLNNNFKTFRPGFTSLDSQIVKQNYTTCFFTVDWNIYYYDGTGNKINKSFYLSIGTKVNIDDNFSDLSKVELQDVQQYGDSTIQRSITKKHTAYIGEYKTGLIGGRTTIDFYKFFGKNSAALHLYPDVNYRQKSIPVYNAGIGLLYSFKDAKDKENKSKLNAELYFRLSDLTNTSNSILSTFERNELGLRLSIPVAFFNF